MKSRDRIGEYIDSHPRESLVLVLFVIGFSWQSITMLAAIVVYVLYMRVGKQPRWLLMVSGVALAVATALLQWSIVQPLDYFKAGFKLNFIFWKLLIHSDYQSALSLFFNDELSYFLGFTFLIAGILSLIELIHNNPHEKMMKSLQMGAYSDGGAELSDKHINKLLAKIRETDHKGTVLGVSKNTGEAVVIPDRDLNQVALVLGTTGSGKTITLRRFYARAISKGYPLIIVDGKPDVTNVDWLQKLAAHHGRQFYGFNCGNHLHYDPLAKGGFTELKDKIICLKDRWENDYYRSIAEDYLQTTLQVLLKSKGKIDLKRVVSCLTYKDLIVLTKEVNDEQLMLRVKSLSNYDMKDITGLQAHLNILIHSELGEYFEQDATTFSLSEVIKQNGVVYFALPALRFPSFSKVLGKLVINDIKAVIDHPESISAPIFTVFDEFSVFAGEQVLNLVNMGRGKGVHAVFGTQGLADLDRVDAVFKEQVLNCVNTLICHRLNDQGSAEAISNWIGTRDGFTVTAQLNAADSAGGLGSVRRNKEFMVHPDDIKQGLRTGEAIYVRKVGGFKWGKVRVMI